MEARFLGLFRGLLLADPLPLPSFFPMPIRFARLKSGLDAILLARPSNGEEEGRELDRDLFFAFRRRVGVDGFSESVDKRLGLEQVGREEVGDGGISKMSARASLFRSSLPVGAVFVSGTTKSKSMLNMD